MSPRRVAGLCCLLGGALWVVDWVAEPPEATADLVRYAGLALLAVGLVVAGAGLARRGSWWLRVLAGGGAAFVTWSVVDVLRPTGDALTYDGLVGASAVLLGLVAVVTGRDRTARRPAGAHAR